MKVTKGQVAELVLYWVVLIMNSFSFFTDLMEKDIVLAVVNLVIVLLMWRFIKGVYRKVERQSKGASDVV